jgi:hypothetical protein
MKRIKHIFKNSEELKRALKSLLAKGYQYDQIIINPKEIRMDSEKELIQASGYGNITLKKSMLGLKSGMIAGAAIVGAAVGLIMAFEIEKSLSPITTFITAVIIGAVWGGVLGFMLGSLFPLDSHINVKNRSNFRNFSIDFLPHNFEDELYFKNKWEPAH